MRAALLLVLACIVLIGCPLHNPVPCEPSPDCVCGPCGIVETVTDASRDR